MTKTFAIIAAMDENRGIGKNNQLPWHLSADMKHFAATTKGGTVIMGRKTWDSLPAAYKPLKERFNIVVSRGEIELPQDVALAHSLDESLALTEEKHPERKVFVIGGAMLFEGALKHPSCSEIIMTQLEGNFDCDTFFPEVPENFQKREESEEMQEEEIVYRFITYSR